MSGVSLSQLKIDFVRKHVKVSHPSHPSLPDVCGYFLDAHQEGENFIFTLKFDREVRVFSVTPSSGNDSCFEGMVSTSSIKRRVEIIPEPEEVIRRRTGGPGKARKGKGKRKDEGGTKNQEKKPQRSAKRPVPVGT